MRYAAKTTPMAARAARFQTSSSRQPFCIPARYSSSVTLSNQLTFLPSSDSWIAMCVMAVVGVAPCQCFWPGGHHRTSPVRISTIGSPSHCVQPQPDVMISVCPSGWLCQALRAPGSNVTLAHETRAGAGGALRGSMRTVPVKYSAGPFCEGCEPGFLSSTIRPRSHRRRCGRS